MRLIKHLGINPEIKNRIYAKVVLNEKLNSRIDKIRGSFLIPDSNELTNKEFIDLLENNEILKESINVVRDFKLPTRWVDIIHRYIVDYDFFTQKDPDGLKLVIDTEDSKTEDDFYLQIFPHTSIKDIKDIWFLVQKEFKKYGYKKTKKKKSKKLNRDLEIYALKKSGNNNAQISNFIEKKYKEDLNFETIKTVTSNQKRIRKG